MQQGGDVVANVSYNPRMLALLCGDLDPADLDDEELARGLCRNDNGKFPKSTGQVVPKAMYDRMTKELFQRSDNKLRAGLVDAVEAIVKMTMDTDVDASTRLKGATWLFERLRGKTPEVVQLTQTKPYETVLTHIHRGPRERAAEEAVNEQASGHASTSRGLPRKPRVRP